MVEIFFVIDIDLIQWRENKQNFFTLQLNLVCFGGGDDKLSLVMLWEIVHCEDEPEAISSLHTSPARNVIIISVTKSDILILNLYSTEQNTARFLFSLLTSEDKVTRVVWRTINLLNFNECACSDWYFGARYTQTFFDLIKDSGNQSMQTKGSVMRKPRVISTRQQIFGIFQIIPPTEVGSGGGTDRSLSLNRANRILSIFGHRVNELWTLTWADYQSSVLLLLVFVLQAVFSIYCDKPTW